METIGWGRKQSSKEEGKEGNRDRQENIAHFISHVEHRFNDVCVHKHAGTCRVECLEEQGDQHEGRKKNKGGQWGTNTSQAQ